MQWFIKKVRLFIPCSGQPFSDVLQGDRVTESQPFTKNF